MANYFNLLKSCAGFTLSLSLVAGANCAFAQDKSKDAEIKTYTGYLLDRACAAELKQTGKDPLATLKGHTKHCSLEPACSEAGYTLYSEGKWLDLDAAGSEKARKAFGLTKKAAGHKFKISGIFKRNELRVKEITEVN
ncbi:MAG: hypothetical protein J0M35_06980 [Candidatus Obscuribacter phosphatis]|uniref:Uncharacterized protein n=1 Tax=Candidatus Obscuribacter phosphatis TaxID=1906157 RepID=A0A8J7P806_9BACT|nr:hypothetical protein [Candidatus Obscuribacter phosphatis]